MQTRVTVIGGVNLDITATLRGDFVRADSNPGRLSLACGGVACNIAQNLQLLEYDVQFVTVFGGDAFGKMCRDQCQRMGLDLSLSHVCDDSRNGMYLCVNDRQGEMMAAVVDNDIMQQLSPDFLAQRIDAINHSFMVVADTNLSTEALQYLVDHCTAPLVVDAVSTAKAGRIVEAIAKSEKKQLYCLKLNHHEAQALTQCESADAMADALLRTGVQHVFVTHGSRGVDYATLQADGQVSRIHRPALTVDVVNTTGAGDAFVAGMVHGWLHGLPIGQVIDKGQQAACAALMTMKTVNPEIMNYLNKLQ